MEMADAAIRRPFARQRNRLAEPEVRIGDRVQFTSGVLAGLVGVIVRCDRRRDYLIAVPDTTSGILVRIPRHRFRRLDSRAA
jgi:hypothetical protein